VRPYVLSQRRNLTRCFVVRSDCPLLIAMMDSLAPIPRDTLPPPSCPPARQCSRTATSTAPHAYAIGPHFLSPPHICPFSSRPGLRFARRMHRLRVDDDPRTSLHRPNRAAPPFRLSAPWHASPRPSARDLKNYASASDPRMATERNRSICAR
jgi:hypothetical protein